MDGGSSYIGFGDGFLDRDGIRYACSSRFSEFGECQIGIGVFYTITLRDYGQFPPSEIILTVPVTVEGYFTTPEDCIDGCFVFNPKGVGIATVQLIQAHDGTYYLNSAKYAFGSVPEPATMTLAGLGLLAVILLRRRAQGLYPDYRRR